MEVISLCNLMNEILPIDENYFGKLFLIDATLSSQGHFYKLRPLVDSGFAAYILVHINLADQICKQLGFQPIPLAKEKLMMGYNGRMAKKAIPHQILPNLTIGGHKELTVPMLIADIGHHDVILGKPWMNKNGALLDMRSDVIVFPDRLDALSRFFRSQPNNNIQPGPDHLLHQPVQPQKCFRDQL